MAKIINFALTSVTLHLNNVNDGLLSEKRKGAEHHCLTPFFLFFCCHRHRCFLFYWFVWLRYRVVLQPDMIQCKRYRIQRLLAFLRLQLALPYRDAMPAHLRQFALVAFIPYSTTHAAQSSRASCSCHESPPYSCAAVQEKSYPFNASMTSSIEQHTPSNSLYISSGSWRSGM